jgi:hypothetical protein
VARDAILGRFGITEAERIGAGGQSIVYGLDAHHVLRLPQKGTFDATLFARQRALLHRIAGKLPFATPLIEEIDREGRYVVERRLPGRAMLACCRPCAATAGKPRGGTISTPQRRCRACDSRRRLSARSSPSRR